MTVLKDNSCVQQKVYRRSVLHVLIAGTLLIILLSFLNLLYSKPINGVQANTTTSYLKIDQKIAKSLPVRLKIPSIKVDTFIESVGLTPGGEMAVPSNAINVGWFSFGPHPGEKGSAVIAGHFDGKNGEAGVFINLDRLKHGDKLYIKDSKGLSTIFVVKEVRTYNPGLADDVFSPSDTAHLNLITCSGVWDQALKSYNKRLIVFADIQPSQSK